MIRKHVLQANNVIGDFLSRKEVVETPVVRMMNRLVLKSLGKWLDRYNEEIEDIRAIHCLKGDKGEILYTGTGKDKSFAVAPENLKETRKAIAEFINGECADEIAKVDWYMFTPDEKKFFEITDEDIYNICAVFIQGIPGVAPLAGELEKSKTGDDEK